MQTQMETTVPNLEYKVMQLDKCRVRGEEKHPLKAQIKIGGKLYDTTQRFWTSFMARFGFSESVFHYFQHQEVIDRICERRPDVNLRFCMDREGSKVYAVSNPDKPVITPDAFMDVARTYGGTDIKCSGSVVTSVYSPTSGDHGVQIGPDTFHNRFFLEMPLDGYGKPSIYLSLLRLVCENGAVAYSPTFRQDITVGDDPLYTIRRSVESFDSDEGYSAVRDRFASAQTSPASLRECLTLYRLLRKIPNGTPMVKRYEEVIGNVHGHYGVANLDGIPEKKLRLLPAKCKVYDLLNLASEMSTHHTKEERATTSLQAWLGGTVAAEYDLEGTGEAPTSGFEGKFFPKDQRKRLARNAAN